MARQLSDVDKKFIADNIGVKTDQEIAKILGCSSRSVARHKEEVFGNSKDVKHVTEFNDAELMAYYRRQFEDSSRGKRLNARVTPDEYAVFLEQWVGYHLQLEDITHTEQNDLEQIIMLKLRADHNQKQYKTQIEFQQKLLKDHGITSIDELDLSDPDQSMLYDRINMAGMQAIQLNKDYKETLDRIDKLNQSLNVTRRQREEKGRVGGDTFFSKCQEFAQKANREREGRMAALLHIATEKNMDNLRKGIKYLDDEIGPQLLDTNTVELMEKQSNES